MSFCWFCRALPQIKDIQETPYFLRVHMLQQNRPSPPKIFQLASRTTFFYSALLLWLYDMDVNDQVSNSFVVGWFTEELLYCCLSSTNFRTISARINIQNHVQYIEIIVFNRWRRSLLSGDAFRCESSIKFIYFIVLYFVYFANLRHMQYHA